MYRLEDITRTIDGNSEMTARMKNDWEVFNSRVQCDREGNKLNPLKLDGAESTDVKILAAKLAHINDHATTQGEHFRIGTLYGFNLLVKTENSQKEGVLIKDVEDANSRCKILKRLGVNSFVQVYRDFDGNIPPTGEQKRFGWYVNQKAVFKATEWEDYR